MSWKTLQSLPVAVLRPALVAYQGWLYACGGLTLAASSSNVYRAKIGVDGSLGPWQLASTEKLPAGSTEAHAFVANGRLYVVVGYNGSDSDSRVYHAKFNSDGSLTSWQRTDLPVACSPLGIGFAQGYVWMVGGVTGTRVSTPTTVAVNGIYRGQINTQTGALEHWTKTNVGVPFNDKDTAGACIGPNAIYLKSVGAKMAAAPLTAGGQIGPWGYTQLPTRATFAPGMIATASRVYMLGGYDSSTFAEYSEVYSAHISGSTGAITTAFTKVGDLPKALDGFGVSISNGVLFIAGGEDVVPTPQSIVASNKLTATGRIS
jgi:N-acetylneuraminic acid mutarotase